MKTAIKKFLPLFSIMFFSLNSNAQEIFDQQHMNAYIVVSDTSQNYFKLRQKMFDLSKKMTMEIDTMGRVFNKKKNLISLPENDKDEIYAGEYFPKRYTSETLSLEYLNYYTKRNKPLEGTIALVVIITKDKKKAENKLAEVRKYPDEAFTVNSRIFTGCAH